MRVEQRSLKLPRVIRDLRRLNLAQSRRYKMVSPKQRARYLHKYGRLINPDIIELDGNRQDEGSACS